MKRVFLAALLGSVLAVNSEARLSSPGNVTFSNPTSPNTTATFDTPGTFILQLAASDGAKTSTGTVTVIVNSAAVLPGVCLGSTSVIAGNPASLATAFSTGTVGVAGLQFDITLPVGVSSTTIAAGPVVTAAGKSISANLVGSALRVLVFGINQTTLGSGILANVTLQIASSLPSQVTPLVVANVTATDINGVNVPMTSCNGSITVTANAAPVVNVGANQTITLPATASLTATATDDGAPQPPGMLTYSWSVL